MRLILSPVGTSVLSNLAGPKRGLLFEHANAREATLPDEVKSLLASLEQEAQQKLSTSDVPTLRRASAELNGILGVYEGEFPAASPDIHWLIATDTYQGKKAAEIIKKFLQPIFPNTQIFIPTGLTTRNKESFESGIQELLELCDSHLPAFQTNEYEIIFNLTGGFKSLQGYLNTIGMFYADRIVYIFETGQELITIPNLPIRMEDEVFVQHARTFLQLGEAPDGIPADETTGIPSLMLDQIDDRCLLSTWGTLIWNQAKIKILSEQLSPLPHLQYESSFEKDFHKYTQVRDKVHLQETLAKISRILGENAGNTASLKAGRAGGILYDNYEGPIKQFGHFRINDSVRVSCLADSGTLRLRHFGTHNYVNDNP